MKVLAIIILAFALAVSASTQTRLAVGAPAPPFSGTSLDGTTVDLSELKGKVVIMTFWSTKCEICHVEFPKLNRVIKSFDGKNVVFLSLTMENDAKVEAYLKSNHLDTQVLPNSFGTLLQYADRDKSGNLDMGFPSYFVINDAGIIEYRSSGYDKTESLNATLTRLLGK